MPLLTPYTPHSHRQTRFPHQFGPRFPTAVSDASFHKAIYSWWSNTGRAGASQEGSRRKEPLGFFHSPSMSNSHRSYLVLGSCLVTECPVTWLCHMYPVPFVMQKDGQFMASCLRVPPRAQSPAPTAAAP